MKQFGVFTNPEAMKAVFERRLPGFSNDGVGIDHCAVLSSRYKSYLKGKSRRKSSLSVSYRLAVTDRPANRRGIQVLYAKVYQDDRSRREFGEALNTRLSAPSFGIALTHLPELGMVVWSFPNDPGLSCLQEVINPQKVKHYFPYDLLPAGLSGPQAISDVTVEVVNYRPETRCVCRYHLQWGPPDQPHTLTLFGKTFADDQGKAIYRRMVSLWKESEENPTGFVTARPLEYNAAVRTIWQESLPGVPLISTINEHNYEEWLTAVAAGLANIHKIDLSVPAGVALDAHLAEVEKKTAKLIQEFPHTRAALEAIVRDLERDRPRLTPLSDRLIHGDFHIRQMLVHGRRIALFDFDEFAIGDPIQDLANFIVDLYSYDFDPGIVRSMAAALVRAYSLRAGAEVPIDRLQWHLRVQFVTKAYRCYWQQKPDLENKIQFFIALAQEGIGFEVGHQRPGITQ